MLNLLESCEKSEGSYVSSLAVEFGKNTSWFEILGGYLSKVGLGIEKCSECNSYVKSFSFS